VRVKDLEFKTYEYADSVSGETNLLHATNGEFGKFTVMNRMTGFGWRDVETGYHADDGSFWLASGNFDIRKFPDLTIEEAIEKTKHHANW